MTLQEAIKSQRPFKRPADHHWFIVDKKTRYIRISGPAADAFEVLPVTEDNLLATDYEVEDLPITVTRAQFWNAYSDALAEYESQYKVMSSNGPSASMLIGEIAKKLGFQ